MARRRVAATVAAGVLLALAHVGPARAFDARVRWMPSGGAPADGYRVYVRLAGVPYGAPLDGGSPAPAPDGSLAYTVRGLQAGRTYYFAVTAYAGAGTDRRESALSEELHLGATDPCAVDRCPSLAGCDFGALPDATSCEDGSFCNGAEHCVGGRCQTGVAPACNDSVPCTTDSCDEALGRCRHRAIAGCCAKNEVCADTDVCTTLEACVAGGCTSTAVPCSAAPCARATCDPLAGCSTIPLPDGTPCEDLDPCTEQGVCRGQVCEAGAAGDIITSRLTLTSGSSEGRLVAAGSFWPGSGLDPTLTGATLELAEASGTVLYRAVVPGNAMRANSTKTSFSLVRSEIPASASGLRRLIMRLRRGMMWVSARAVAAELRSAAGRAEGGAPIVWVVRVGAECVRDMDLACAPGTARVSCR